MPKPPVSIIKTSNLDVFMKRITSIGNMSILVGIPSGSSENRSAAILARSERFTSSRKSRVKTKERLKKIALATSVSNAYLLYIFSKGSPLNKQPARPVIEPAIKAPWNRKEISDLVARASVELVAGRNYNAKKLMNSAGARAAKAARDWFDDPRNGWAGNAASTISHKGFDRPGIDTTAMRNAITYELRET